MKFSITMRDPDRPYETIRDSVEELLDGIAVDADDKEILINSSIEKLEEFVGQWLEYGGLVTIDFDTEKNIATIRRV